MFHDVFVAAVSEDRKADYRAQGERVARVFKAHGALAYVENWGADVPDGEVTSFPKAVGLKPGEVVVIGWSAWPDKAARDRAMPEIMADPAMQVEMKSIPVDGKRMIFGGFETLFHV